MQVCTWELCELFRRFVAKSKLATAPCLNCHCKQSFEASAGRFLEHQIMWPSMWTVAFFNLWHWNCHLNIASLQQMQASLSLMSFSAVSASLLMLQCVDRITKDYLHRCMHRFASARWIPVSNARQHITHGKSSSYLHSKVPGGSFILGRCSLKWQWWREEWLYAQNLNFLMMHPLRHLKTPKNGLSSSSQ